MKQAFLLLSCKLSKAIIDSFNEISMATNSDQNLTCLLYHQKDFNKPHEITIDNAFYFSDDILVDLNYIPLGSELIPGNNHFPLLKFYKANPDYDYYWCIEDDVRYTGNWDYFFSYFENSDKSFISSHVQKYKEDPHWPWWNTLRYDEKTLKSKYKIKSFNPIYRISKDALDFIDQKLLEGWQGHHEVLFPTLLNAGGFEIMDFGGQGEFVAPGDENKFYFGNYGNGNTMENLESTLRWRPIHESVGKIENKLYHPIKD